MRRHVLQPVGRHHAHVARAADPVVHRVPAVLQIDELGAPAAGQDVLRRGLVPIAAVMVVGFEDRPQRHLLLQLAGVQIVAVGRLGIDRPVPRPARLAGRRLPGRRSTSRPDRRSRTRLSIRTTGGRCTSSAGSTAAGRCPRRSPPACSGWRGRRRRPARSSCRSTGCPPSGCRPRSGRPRPAGTRPATARRPSPRPGPTISGPSIRATVRPSVAMFSDGSNSAGSLPPCISFHLM